MGSLLDWLPGVGAVASFVGQERANAANVRSAREQMAFQERMVGRQEAFQERMANTAVQRQMADLRAAGVNPMLAVMNGTPGASAPQGSSAMGARAEQRDSIGPAVDRGVQSVMTGLAVKRQKAELRLLKEQADKTFQEGMLTQQERLDRFTATGSDFGQAMLNKLQGEIANLGSSSKLADVNRELAELEKPGAANRARLETMIGREFGVGGQAAKGIVDVLIQMLKLGISARSGPVPLVRDVRPIGFGR